MKKSQLVDKVLEFPAHLVWELDKQVVYAVACWDGKSTWWNLPALNGSTKAYLEKLIKQLDWVAPLDHS